MKHAKQDGPERASSLTRRSVLGGSVTLATANLLAAPAAAAASSARPVLVQVFLRNGMDGCTLVVPHADGDYYALRPNVAVPPPGSPSGALDLDGFFGLAPAAAPLLTPYNDGKLVFVHACGSPDPTRSHFDAFARMECADPTLASGAVTSGWLTRYLVATAASATAPLRAIGTSSLLPLTLRLASQTLPIPDLSSFYFPGRALTGAQRQAAVARSYARRPAPLGPAALDSLASFSSLGGVDFDGYVPENGAVYPSTELGRRLRNVAALIKADVGVEAFTVDVEGWDLHASLGPLDGAMAALMDELSRALAAFYLDLLAHEDGYVLVGLTEFGRHLSENSSLGLDHGHGSAMFVMGGHVAGGQVLASWPGLDAGALDSGDLAITTDYRDVLGEILVERMGLANLAPIFPGHAYAPAGVIA